MTGQQPNLFWCMNKLLQPLIGEHLGPQYCGNSRKKNKALCGLCANALWDRNVEIAETVQRIQEDALFMRFVCQFDQDHQLQAIYEQALGDNGSLAQFLFTLHVLVNSWTFICRRSCCLKKAQGPRQRTGPRARPSSSGLGRAQGQVVTLCVLLQFYGGLIFLEYP